MQDCLNCKYSKFCHVRNDSVKNTAQYVTVTLSSLINRSRTYMYIWNIMK